VRNVNDFLYDYSGSIKAELAPEVSLSRADLASLLGVTADKCAVWKAAAKVFQPAFVLTKAKDTDSYKSIALDQSLKDWTAFSPLYQNVLAKLDDSGTCSDPDFKTLFPKMQRAARAASGNHEYDFSDVLQTGMKFTITVEEKYAGELTTKGKSDYVFQPGSSTFFLSVGYLATELQNRSYDTITVGKDAQNNPIQELRIQGTGKFTQGAAVLLNYKVPRICMKTSLGCALSAGPVFRLGGNGTGSTATNWGFFVGASMHLWERFWVTPGFHLGQFSDLPLGFTAAKGLVVPDGITNPITGVNRSTWRFGIAITFRAADFKQALPTTSTANTPGTGAGAGTAEPPAGGAAVTPPSGNTIADQVKKLKADLDAATTALTTAKTDEKTKESANIIAKNDSDKANKAATDAAKELGDAAKASDDARTVLAAAEDALKKATEPEKAAAQKKLDDAKATSDKASDRLSAAIKGDTKARSDVSTATTALKKASDDLAAATKVTLDAQKKVTDLQTQLKAIQDAAK
jgi:hypothetical protein